MSAPAEVRVATAPSPKFCSVCGKESTALEICHVCGISLCTNCDVRGKKPDKPACYPHA